MSDGLGVAEDAGRRVEHVHELSVTHVQAVVHGHVLVPELRRVQPCNTTCTALLLSLPLSKFVAELVTAQVRALSDLEPFTLHCVSSLYMLAFTGVGQNENKMLPTFISNQNRKDINILKINLPNFLAQLKVITKSD